ncbi:carbohydrate sulfotransferase 15-like [Ruditapes philippinarum]|uniref:carbohydrate sulfotransferase 15-like n=1 Tax=Ruditapes philippinarum TaxID=129788 RepID=UPI00295A70E5|nr:carbohydrate sulfotransferase 15-like [Ruditapes philippinarum]
MLEGLFQQIDKTPQEMKLPPFLKNFKNPCWIERNINDTNTRIRCLPYFYLVGMPKCGTSDFYKRITQHPSISNKSRKETHWFSRRGFSRNGKYKSLTNYLQLYDHIVTEDVLKSKQTNGRHSGIFGDFSGTYWDSNKLLMNWNDKNGKEAIPPFTISDVIHKLNPATKILFLLRNPVKRIYSDYLYFGKGKKDANDFHAKIKAAIQRHWGNINTKMYALVGQMLPETKTLLSDFYRKHNENLSKLLGENMTYD